MLPLPVLALQAVPLAPQAPAEATGWTSPRTTIYSVDIPLAPWAVVLLLVAFGLLFHFVLRSALHAWAKRTTNDLDDILIEISSRIVPLWVLLSIAWIGVEMLRGGEDERVRLRANLFALITAAFILSLFWVVGTLLLRSLAKWAQEHAEFKPVYPPIRFVLKSVLLVVAVVTVLAYLQVNISALLATLGVGGLAVALALKDTLENFFAGLHIMADRPFVEGDTVMVQETGDRGVILKVGWRSTRIRTADNNILVVPNVKLASGILTNLSARDARVHARIQVGVSYDCDPDRVREVLADEVAAAVGKLPGLSGDPPPGVWLHPGFGPSSLDFTIRVTVLSADDAVDVQDGLRRRIFRRLKSEGIPIPYPTTTVEIRKMPGEG